MAEMIKELLTDEELIKVCGGENIVAFIPGLEEISPYVPEN